MDLPQFGTEAQRTRRSGGRIGGIDAARALALIGMAAVHVGPEDVVTVGGRLYALAHGRASVLFVLLAGIGVALLSRRAPGAARLRLAAYALVLLPLGLILQGLGHPIAIILHHYAAFFLFAILVLGLPARGLLALALAMPLLGPLFYLYAGVFEPSLLARRSVSIGHDPFTILNGLLIAGPYPLLVWCGPLLWGLWLGRQDLRRPRTAILIALGGALLFLAAIGASRLLTGIWGEPTGTLDWRRLLVHTAHSEMPLWLFSSIGSGMCVLGITLLLASRFPRVFAPLVAMGQLSLSLYVAHVLALTWWGGALAHDSVRLASLSVLVMAVVGMAFAVIWRRHWPRGPVEMLMQLSWQALDRAFGSGRSPDGAEPVAVRR